MSNSARRLILIIGGVACVAIVLFAYFVLVPRDEPVREVAAEPVAESAQQVAERFTEAWARADHAAAASVTDQPGPAKAALTAAREALAPEDFAVALTGKVSESGAGAIAKAKVTWTLPDDRELGYAVDVGMVRQADAWKVRWAPTLVHPKMTSGLSLAYRAGTDVQVVDRDGEPLVRGGKSLPAAGPVLGPGLGRVGAARDEGPKAVVLVDGAGKEKAQVLAASAGERKGPYKSTMDASVQKAAQAAVDGQTLPAYLVAFDASTGGILAVAQNGAAGGAPKALNGLYPPGSTFKVVTATAVLSAGSAGLDTVVPCPGEDTIGSRTIRNDGFELGEVPLRTAFARSCNTSFAALAADLPGDALVSAADRFGLGADFTIPGITTQTGKVVPAAAPRSRSRTPSARAPSRSARSGWPWSPPPSRAAER
ncbi:penicillin-binding transpeptidase domain-containing protein [Actinokineospora soli]|uniref:Penicillin-binding transpeptidase domain-containing protein n=1 Tax=Actinokineospora soli TaxID=1048753 RepID=A0ABW2TWC3_9PSEU